MKGRTLLSILFLFGALCFTYAQKPYWWENAHRDDETNMYERGSSVGAETEQAAVLEAVLAAKNMLIQRIGIAPALEEAGISSSAEYAIVNAETSDIGTEKTGKTWSAWLLLKYPQKEKNVLLDRWNASIASMQEMRRQERKIPRQFALALSTVSGQNQFREGDTIAFSVTAEKDCYLLLLDHMSDGTTVLLFPNRFNPDSFVKKGQRIEIPAPENAAFKLLVSPPFGDDRIEAIASTKKSSLHAKFSDLVEDLPGAQDVAVMSRGIFVQGLGTAVDSAPVTGIQWSQTEITISTFQK
jgi:hypothetical protein